MQGKVKPEDTETVVTNIRQKKDGCILLELGGVSKYRDDITGALKSAVSGNGTVESRSPKITLEIRDIDGYTTADEVEAALKRNLKESVEKLKVSVGKPNTRGQILAIVEISERAANELLKTERLKIGWVNRG